MLWFRNMGNLKIRAALDWLVRNVPRLPATYVVTTWGHVYMIHDTSSPCIKGHVADQPVVAVQSAETRLGSTESRSESKVKVQAVPSGTATRYNPHCWFVDVINETYLGAPA